MTQENPFKATQIWEEIIRSFRAGMPSRRQRLKMRFYDNCFTGEEALEWLHRYLQTRGSFSSVTTQQAKTLLQKFLASCVIEEVRGRRLDIFKDDTSHLYHFVKIPGPFNFVDDENSPKGGSISYPSISDPSNTSLGKRKRNDDAMDYEGAWFTNEFASSSFDDDEDDRTLTSEKRTRLKSSKVTGDVPSLKKYASPLTRRMEEASKSSVPRESVMVTAVWKELTLNKLLSLIELSSLDGILNEDTLDGRHISSNVLSMARAVGGAVGGACSSAAQRYLTHSSGCGLSSSLVPPPASHVTRQHSSSRLFSTLSTHLHHHHHHHHHHPSTPNKSMNDFPQWIILALDCLSKWPDSCNEEFMGGMPIYGGFELDVFKSLLQYFHSQPRPLILTKHFDLYMAVQKLIRKGHTHSVTMEAVQLCLLLLPHGSRVKIHRVLRFMNKASTNTRLQLSKNQSNWSVLMDQVAPVILHKWCKMVPPEVRENLESLITYMMKEYHTIFRVPGGLEMEVKQRIEQLENGKGSPPDVRHTFCQQVSTAQYEEDCHSTHHQWMTQLLDDIITNKKMSDKEKRKKLKMFQKQYPNVYLERFHDQPHPLTESAAAIGGASYQPRGLKKLLL